ncbi:MAG TPA: hypothetical protein VJ698_15760 [Noviherbaspirillum sp.]|uniref:hypothetical protein n=1 Tax=Noviherbaspirillum sp. TaxID=1926288 RepID=UPI002B4A7BA1|nr:hypothetical protein [Noviherbaspirillum sp.]HJV86922.1 hypothetical protein [Noviherbaspirillum sp.]
MDDNAVSADTGTSWWQNTLDFVVRAAATKKYASPQLQNGQSYYVDGMGNVLPMGQPAQIMPNQAAGAMLGSPVVMLAVMAFAGVILYKLVK